MIRLTGGPKDYAWGSTTLLSNLRGTAPSATPEAELWYGAHPGSATMGDNGMSLLDYVEQNPEERLGQPIIDRFGAQLPFLLKLIAADTPLSIQAHPTAEQARAGFAAEEAAGVPRDAPDRSFRDDTHKPELIVALTNFEALVGFRAIDLTVDFFDSIGWTALSEPLQSKGPKHVVDGLLQPESWDKSPEDIDEMVNELVSACRLYPGGLWRAETELLIRLASDYPGDPGVAVASLLNRVSLEPGEGLFLDAGHLHSYVGGLAVEVMANCDNVLRGGLTPKYIDVANLLDVVLPDVFVPERVIEEADGRYETPAPEFELRHLDAATSREVEGPSIILGTHGTTSVTTGEDQLELAPTEAVWLEVGERATVSGTDFSAWLASVG